MKDDFSKEASPSTLTIPRRWPEWVQPSGKYTGAMGPDRAPERIASNAISCVAFATPDDKVKGYCAVFMIAEGVKSFVTFLTPAEEKTLRDALSRRDMLTIDAANGPVQPGFLNCFEHPQDVLLDTSHITRITGGPRQQDDFILFDVVFGKSQNLPVCARDADFDSQAVIDASPIFEKYNETPREKWFREADEGTLISNAFDAYKARHRAILNDFARDLAAKAPQLYQIENTKHLYFTRPVDIDDIFIFTEQTDAARITYKPIAGEQYGMPIMETAYFTSPEGAIEAVAKLRQKMEEKPASAAKPPALK